MNNFFLLCLVYMLSTFVLSDCEWNGAPEVEQINLTTVRVSWLEVLKNKNCADKIFVKYWIENRGNDYDQSDRFSPETVNNCTIKIEKGQFYIFQIIAKKGSYNQFKNPNKTKFKTRRSNPEVEPNDPLPTPTESHDNEDGLTQLPPITKETKQKKPEEGQGFEFEEFISTLGIIIGSLIGVTVAFGIIYNFLRKRKSKRDAKVDSKSGSDDENEEAITNGQTI